MRFGVSPEKQAELEARMQKLGIREDDLVERFVRARGPGGQKINKTSVAVQIRHGPTGSEVRSQRTRSQAQNRFWARRLLCERLEAKIEGRKSARQQKAEKIRRQKRKRSKRAKDKMLATKRKTSEKKQTRRKPGADD